MATIQLKLIAADGQEVASFDNPPPGFGTATMLQYKDKFYAYQSLQTGQHNGGYLVFGEAEPPLIIG